MKHSDTSIEEIERIKSILCEYGSPDPDLATTTMLAHLELVLEENRTTNLTAIRSWEDALRLHIEDSLTALPDILRLGPGEITDIGTGAGFPGVVLAAASGRQFELVDSVRKKCDFLARAVQALDFVGPTPRVTWTRIEELSLRESPRRAAVTARALSALPSLVELAAPLLDLGGELVAMKGPISAEEIDRGKRAGAVCGMRLTEVREAWLSGGETRTIVRFTRVGTPRIQLPRRVGLAQKQPLA